MASCLRAAVLSIPDVGVTPMMCVTEVIRTDIIREMIIIGLTAARTAWQSIPL